MGNLIRQLGILFVGVLMGVSSLAQEMPTEAGEYDFIKPYVAAKNKLKKLPEKKIEKTPFCSNMDVMINRAMPADRSQKKLRADRIVVSKTRRKLYLFSHRELISEYNVAFGFGSFEGAKSQSGDGRTPEGIYQIDNKKEDSSYHRALHVSYPNAQDEAFATANKVKAGDSIMVHGYPETAIDGLDPVLIPQIHPRVDWTQGCIAVSNHEIEEIFNYVDEGITIEVCPLEEKAIQPKTQSVSEDADQAESGT